MKLWEKGITIDEAIERFTVGKDRELDLYLAPFDIIGSLAHIKMLHSIEILADEELKVLENELKDLYESITNNEFKIERNIEDIHSQVEYNLTKKLGDIGRKIHSGRSRNDQVLLDIKLFIRDAIRINVENTSFLIDTLIQKSFDYKDVLMPGYTHLQVAMPSSFGLWFGAYAESLVDDLLLLESAFRISNQNPLGSGAGYGSSFPLDRKMTTELLGFDSMNYNVVYAQMGRGKVEKIVAFALSNLAGTLSKLAYDVCLFMSQNFGFVGLPPELTTGSSIMPHKKNPDVFELVRAKCNNLQSLPQQILMISNNLPSGYFRDYQEIKELFFPAFETLNDCLGIVKFAIEKMTVNRNILEDEKYKYIYSVEEVNKLVLKGIPFREAYRQVGFSIENKKFNPDIKIQHTHEGSIGNLCLDKIKIKKESIIKRFGFEKITSRINSLLED